MNANSGNIQVSLTTIVTNEEVQYPRINIQMCFLLKYEMMVKHIQDCAKKQPEYPHFLAESIKITIDGTEYDFCPGLDFRNLIHNRDFKHTPKVDLTVIDIIFTST